jgi:RNA polymerase sigma-70 factor (TIGR02960 family)
VVSDDPAAFTALVDGHRRELHVHCYRMLASYDDAEDAVQEVMVRAWRHRDRLDDIEQRRPWLYRIATNVCLDAIRRRGRRPVASTTEVTWLQPYPDVALAEATDDVVVRKETVELAFVVALQALPPRQRAALIARDVLGWPATETAEHLGTSVAAANSALQRARVALADRLPARRRDWTMPSLSDEEREVLAGFIEAHERGDHELALALAATDITVTMPPAPMRFVGRDGLRPLLERAFGPDRDGDWRLLPTAANCSPAAASYLRRRGDSRWRGFKLDVLHVIDRRIATITTFGPSHFPRLGLPDELDD